MPPRMPFGKYKHHNLEDIPDDYLRWLLGTVDLAGWLLSAVRRELQARDADEPPRGYRHQETARTTTRPDLRGIVSRWHRTLSKQFHPDRGGDERAMQTVNVGRDLLFEMLREEGLLN
jgi:hypothetical protein